MKINKFYADIEEKFPNSNVKINDLAGDGEHLEVVISSPEFENLSIMQCHRLLNTRLKDWVGEKIHAVTFKIQK